MFWKRNPKAMTNEIRIRQYLIKEHYRCVNEACNKENQYSLGAMDEISKIIGDVQAICDGNR